MDKCVQFFILILLGFTIMGCQNSGDKLVVEPGVGIPGHLQVAHLGPGLRTDFFEIRNAFRLKNPGYDLEYIRRTYGIDPKPYERIVFMQTGGGMAKISTGDSSMVSVGDIIQLHANEIMVIDSMIDVLAFIVPEVPSDSIPRFIRPDWDPGITDIPGGCATDTGAYRRILLTWSEKNGPYIYHALNAHRVRITDSFTHYHPTDIGFDEFYLVQMARPGAKLYYSERLDLMEDPTKLNQANQDSLIAEIPLSVGDLVYIPRGVIHRGYGGVLAQVITIPGFIPGSEIGVDHLIFNINKTLNLIGPGAYPFNREASSEAVIR